MKRTLGFLSALFAAGSLHSAVAVRVNGNGHFLSFVNDRAMVNGVLLHWQPVETSGSGDFLNPLGDVNGDLAPAAVVLPAGLLQVDPTPVVVWPRSVGTNHDIYFSYWLRGTGWRLPERLGAPSADNEHGVRLFLDPNNDVHAVWERSSTVPGIWNAEFTGALWTAPTLVSDPQADSRHPQLVLEAERDLYVVYELWGGGPIRVVSFLRERFDP